MLSVAIVIGTLTLCLLGNFSCFFVICEFCQLFRTILSGISCVQQFVQIRPDILSVLIRVQTVCKDNQQTTLVDKKLKVKVWVTRFFFLKMLVREANSDTPYLTVSSVWSESVLFSHLFWQIRSVQHFSKCSKF